ILELSNAARQVAAIDVAQSRLAPDGCRSQQILRTRVVRRNHLVILMKRGHVPRDIGRDASYELSQFPQFSVAVIEPWNQERHDFQPDSHLVQAADGVKNRLQTSAKLPIVPIIEALQIHFVQIDPRMQILQHLRRPVAIRNESGLQAGFTRLPENCDCPLARDQRLVVRAHQDLGALPQRVFHQELRIGFAQHLRSVPVLAIRTMQVATQHSKAVGERARRGVEERLLLDGIALHSGNISERHVKDSASIEADLAYANLAFRNRATVPAGIAAYSIAINRFPKRAITLANPFIKDLAQRGHMSIVRRNGGRASPPAPPWLLPRSLWLMAV